MGKEVKYLAKQLRNVGPKLAAKLIAAGIDSPEKLRRIGTKRAFEKMYAAGDSYGDFNAAYLFALEGAIRDCDWLDIPEEIKREYKQYARTLQSKKDGEANGSLHNAREGS
jgi:DNA transformation protein